LRTKKTTAALAALLTATGVADAQGRANSDTTLPEVKVSADKDAETATGPVRGYVAKRSATATKTDTPLSEVPQSISVITADQLKDQASPNLQEALRYTAGVRHELYGIDNRGDWIGLRGSEEATVLLDGMRLPLTGWYGVVRTEPYNYERIEVLRGPSSIIAGANDPGGVVNLVSKRPHADAVREVGIVLGSYEHKELHTDLTGPLDADGRWLYRLVALGRESGTQIEHADERRALLAPSVTWRPRAGDTLTLYGEYQYDRSKNTNAFLGLEGTLYDAPNGRIPSDLFIGEPDWDRYGGTRKRVGYAADFGLGETWRLRHNLRHDDVDGLQKSMYAAWWEGFVDAGGNADPNGHYMNRLWYIYEDSSRITTAEALLQGDLRTGNVRHTLLLGIDGMHHDASQTVAEGAATPLNVYGPVYGTFAEPALSASAVLTENRIRRVGALVQDQLKFSDRLSVRAGLRHDKVRNSVGGAETERDSANSANLGVVYEVMPGFAPYASYSESFNPVAGVDAQGQRFKPKRGEQFEVGLKWDAQPLQATLAFYKLKEKNRLATDPDPNDFGRSIQIGQARVRGAELEVKADTRSWELLGSYTYMHARGTADAWGTDLDPNQQLSGIPEHTASLWAVHRFVSLGVPGLRAGGGVRYVSRIGDGTGNVFVPDVTLFDAMASYVTGPWRFALNVNNLTDKDYIATCLSRGDCWFGQRRKATLTADYRW
jgi:iron complex outermembrane receptor protein